MSKRTKLSDIQRAANDVFSCEVLDITESRYATLRDKPRYFYELTIVVDDHGLLYRAVTFTAETRDGARRFALETLQRGAKS